MEVKTVKLSKDRVFDLNRVKQRFDTLNRAHRLILESVSEGIFGLDRQGRVTFMNPAAATMLGWNTQETLGEDLHSLIHQTGGEDITSLRESCPVCASFKDGEIHRVNDEVFWRKDGMSFPVVYTSTPIRERNAIVGSVVTFRDTTDRKESEDRVRQS